MKSTSHEQIIVSTSNGSEVADEQAHPINTLIPRENINSKKINVIVKNERAEQNDEWATNTMNHDKKRLRASSASRELTATPSDIKLFSRPNSADGPTEKGKSHE
ncbi:unnamed protein product [Didymodactylos carnosus]|uniref:Uncharacterized protein n=1 Tax=Didymodactylos carnosus TaxID=1234261 RepID=A0A813YMF4_9BILA|nr:unnamed protein product [Didymodactylos carnosus]CAF3671554.1 unnamed protein product [Didymodactylos carnosus]